MCTIHSSKSSYSLFEYFVYVLQHMKVHYAVVLEVGRDCRPHLSKLCSIIPPFLHPSLPFSILHSLSPSFTTFLHPSLPFSILHSLSPSFTPFLNRSLLANIHPTSLLPFPPHQKKVDLLFLICCTHFYFSSPLQGEILKRTGTGDPWYCTCFT